MRTQTNVSRRHNYTIRIGIKEAQRRLTYLRFRKELPVLRITRRADRQQLLLQPRDVVLLQCKPEVEHMRRICRSILHEPTGGCITTFVDSHGMAGENRPRRRRGRSSSKGTGACQSREKRGKKNKNERSSHWTVPDDRGSAEKERKKGKRHSRERVGSDMNAILIWEVGGVRGKPIGISGLLTFARQ